MDDRDDDVVLYVSFDKIVSFDKTRRRVRIARSARKHKIGNGHIWQALNRSGEPRRIGGDRLLWIGVDDRGVELEIVAVPGREDDELLFVIHVMPTAYRKEGYWDDPGN